MCLVPTADEIVMTQDIHADRILILDLGSPYTQLIARQVRQAGVYCEVHAGNKDEAAIREFQPRGIILSGVAAAQAFSQVPDIVWSLGVPVLGVDQGMQCMASHFGGRLQTALTSEYRQERVRARGHSPLLQDIQDHVNDQGHGLLDVWLDQGWWLAELPAGFKGIASTQAGTLVGMADEQRGLYGLQFHPEVEQTPQGQQILARFVQQVCDCQALWTPQYIIADLVARIRAQVGNQRVLLGLSGGVDSSVTAALIHQAIGNNLVCVFVDNGLLRQNEADEVMATFAQHKGMNVIRADAETQFLARLAGVTDPETKRKIIGNTFIEIFDSHAAELENIQWLAQGTIYPDVIESAGQGGGQSGLVKSHHNVGGLPADMKLGLVEPLRELFKDEVRQIGLALDLPHDMLMRHPFPGPGLGVRILGEVRKAYADKLRAADAIFIEELRQAGWYDRVSQAFAVYLPVSSVGVTSRGRRFEHVIALRAVETVDFMTAQWAELPYALINRVVTRILDEVPGISRVVYDVTGKPPGTIEWE